MITRIVFKVLSLLSACMILNSPHVMAETESTYPYADIEALKENATDSDKNKNLVKQNKTNTFNASNQNKRSIKMIVGGKSEDGIAKQVTLPVDD